MDRTGEQRKKHSILTYKTESGRMGCINRDKSAVDGMKLIEDYYMENRKRHPIYERKKAMDHKSTKKESKKNENKIVKNKESKKVVVKRIDESGKDQLQKGSEF